jgi:hypothetical protein
MNFLFSFCCGSDNYRAVVVRYVEFGMEVDFF